MDAAIEASARWGRQGTVRTLGPLIHNPQALSHLSLRGVESTDFSSIQSGETIIVRAHGIPLSEYRSLKKDHQRGRLKLVNSTCPEVARVQACIRRHSSKGRFVIILGQADHPEVIAHQTYAAAGCAIVRTLEEAQQISVECLDTAIVVAQTTFELNAFHIITDHLSRRSTGIRVFNTICPDTWKRQRAAQELASRVDAVVVVGGRSSNNTRHLMEVAQTAGKPAQWVESVQELDLGVLRSRASVGVLAGASTPTWIVDEVVDALEQAGKPSLWRRARQLSSITQLPQAACLSATALWLCHRLRWPGALAQSTIVFLTLTGLCLIAPFLSPRGFHAKGQVRSAFLRRNRAELLGAAFLAFLVSLVLTSVWLPAARLPWLLLVAASLTFIRFHGHRNRQFLVLPGGKDFAQALLPVMLILGLPIVSGYPASLSLIFLMAIGVFSIGLALHSRRHVTEFHEDRILGPETLPVAIGLQGTRWTSIACLIIALTAILIGV